MVGKMVENPLSYYGRYKGLNRFYYWQWGFENNAVTVVAFKSTSLTPITGGNLVPGDVFTDVAMNSFTFLRTEKTRNESIYIFEAATVAPILQTGNLTNATPNPDVVVAFTSHSGLMYEHLYELDASGRRYRLYNAAEVAATGAAVTDKKNLMATLGKRMSNYDIRYANAMLKDFTIKTSSPGLQSIEGNFLAYKEERGSHNSAAWSLSDGLCDGQLVPTHFEHRFFIGTEANMSLDTTGAITGLDELGMSNVDIKVAMPLQSLQDFVSGLSIAEPELEGKYDIGVTGTISRHTVSTYQGYRDNQTVVVGHLHSNQGWYMQEYMIKEATLPTAGPDESEIAQEPLDLKVGFVCGATSAFDDWLEGFTETQQSPILFRVRDYEPQNSMLEF
jgi:hypothetical protein